MTSSLTEALPSGISVDYAPRSQSFEFQPIDDYSNEDVGELPDGITADDLGGEARASGSLTRAGVTATLSVSVEESTRDVPPCTAGVLDERRRTDDGAVVDLNDTWSEYPGTDEQTVRTYTRSVDAWLPDGSVVRASMSSDVEQWPLTRDDMVTLALEPGLQTTAAVPPGTPSPAPACPSTYDDEGPYVKVTPDMVDAWNSALRSGWPGGVPGLEIDRNLASLEPADTFLSGACATFDLTGPTTTGAVGISISSDNALPVAPDPYDPQYSESLPELTMLADGSVEVITDDWYSSVPMNPTPDDPGGMERYLSVEVTHPSGYAVDVFARGTNPPPVQLLQAIASTPGLDGK
ncbi:hypothetical protein GCM10007304_34520 [Rhodococcoides trifolii]|uniref:Uncharacterized protein n=2 Tax=Rhodococcoides trifolii TaxID=908250 RepID=A0A917G126_9NOCA|nr:hypothetical protein GCM10007304_34520 [Rhodococcus trifolii]